MIRYYYDRNSFGNVSYDTFEEYTHSLKTFFFSVIKTTKGYPKAVTTEIQLPHIMTTFDMNGLITNARLGPFRGSLTPNKFIDEHHDEIVSFYKLLISSGETLS